MTANPDISTDKTTEVTMTTHPEIHVPNAAKIALATAIAPSLAALLMPGWAVSPTTQGLQLTREGEQGNQTLHLSIHARNHFDHTNLVGVPHGFHSKAREAAVHGAEPGVILLAVHSEREGGPATALSVLVATLDALAREAAPRSAITTAPAVALYWSPMKISDLAGRPGIFAATTLPLDPFRS